MPPLNQRREDILPLSKFFLERFTQKFAKSFTGFEPDAASALEQFNWTGNIRELRNLIERAVLLGSGTLMTLSQLGMEEIPSNANAAPLPSNCPNLPPLNKEGIDITALLQSIEKTYFDQALELSKGNASKAAKLLRLSRDKFRYRRQKI